jgi:L-seryl-tRNA(Ser) seleniumtransferase
MKDSLFRLIPSVDVLIGRPEGQRLADAFGRPPALEAIRETLEAVRADIQAAADGGAAVIGAADLAPDALLGRVRARLERRLAPSLGRAINATGIVIHTGLGRAVLAAEARAALARVSLGYSGLAVDFETGQRGHRDVHYASLLRDLTGAEAGFVVNNNAAATVIILNTLARGKEVLLSRGQLVEIGGSFRMPDVMETSGAILREVGTTNKTHLRDYEGAISDRTGLILRVHHSNYRIMGFAEEPGIEELVELGRKHGLPVVDDIGSGALVDLKAYGLETEPLVRKSVRSGADAVCFSGDKLIGGPQAGIIVGKADAVARIKKNPLARAFRVGKLTAAALEATLKLFLDPDRLRERHPVYRMLGLDAPEIGRRAKRAADALAPALAGRARVSVAEDRSQVGSGSVPVETLPTFVLNVEPDSVAPEELARRLRKGDPAVFVRVHKDALYLDFRTIFPEEDAAVLAALRAAFGA